MSIEVGENMVWHRISDDNRRIDKIPVKIMKVVRNGVFVELMLPDGMAPPDGIKLKARLARRQILPIPPPPAPYARPATPPAPKPMLGQPEGRIPEFLPMSWDPMIAVGDPEQIVHAVPSDNRALCGLESGRGWQWGGRELEITCPHCWRAHLEAEFEKDSIVKCLRKYGHTGPITRDDYISFNWAGCSIRDR
jgi:hypothetical protein